MKKICIFLGLALSALLVIGCNKQETTPQGDGTVKIDIIASMEELTKTTMSYDAANTQYIPSWEIGDKLSVYTAAAGTTDGTTIDTEREFSIVSLSDGVATNFSGTIAAPASGARYDFYAAYPKSGVNASNCKYANFKVTLPSVQYPSLNSFDPSSDILAGIPVQNIAVSETNTIQFSFTRKTSVLKVIPSYSGDIDGVPSDAKIKSIKIDFGVGVTGRITWNLSQPNEDLDFSSPEKTVNYVTAEYSTEKPNLNGGNVFLSIVPVNLNSATISVTITTDEDAVLTKNFLNMTKNIEVGKVTPITFTIDNSWNKTIPQRKNISEVRNMELGTISGAFYIKGRVVSNKDCNNTTSLNNIYLQDSDAEKSGIIVRLDEAANNTFAVGDELQVNIMGAVLRKDDGTKLNLWLKPIGDSHIVKTSSLNSPLAAKSITVEQLKTGNYESMYVQIADVQVSEDDLEKIMGDSPNVETINNSFVMYSGYNATFKGVTVPQYKGTLKGIACVFNTTFEILPQSTGDYADLNVASHGRFLTFGAPVFSGSMTAGTALSGCTITIPVNNITSAQTYKVSVTATGAGSAGITNPFSEASVTTDSNDKLVINLTGTPTTAGAVVFSVVIKDNDASTVLTTLVVNVTVASAGTTYFEKVTSSLTDWSGTYLIVVFKDPKYYAFTSNIDSDWSRQIEVNLVEGRIENTASISTAVCTFIKNDANYNIRLSDGMYISNCTAKLIESGSTPVDLTITYSADGVSIGNITNTTWLRLNTNSGCGFRFYSTEKTTGYLPSLYKLAI